MGITLQLIGIYNCKNLSGQYFRGTLILSFNNYFSNIKIFFLAISIRNWKQTLSQFI